MKLVKIDKLCVTVIALFVTFAINSQVKDDISIVQYTASFVEQVSLDDFNDYNTQTLFLEKSEKIFKKEKIVSIPTLVLYNDGEEVLKIDGGISMKLPEDYIDEINKHINKILETRF